MNHRSFSRLLLPLAALCLLLAALSSACGGGGGDAPVLSPISGDKDIVAAPEFPPGHTWLNVPEPLTIAGLRGKAVLLDFWTLGCINCQHVIPDLTRLEEEFGDALVVIGVHSGKYDREHADQSIRDAIRKYGLQHPVVNDPNFVIWKTYGVNAWPSAFLIDPAGNLAGYHQGEGYYPVIQPALARIVEEFDARGEIDRTPIALDPESEGAVSPVLSFPSAIAVDETNARLFIADAGNSRGLVSGLDGALQYAIGSGEEGLTDGDYTTAQFRQPQGLTLSTDGNTLYVADTRNHAVRAVDLPGKTVRTVAGTGQQAASIPADAAPALETGLASPWGLLQHGETLYIAMAGTHQIWTLDLAAGRVAVFAGSRREGIADGPRLEATLAQPSGLTTDGTYLYWVDPESSSVRRTPLSGDFNVETVVGRGLFDFGDTDGPRESALLEHPQGITYANGLLYVADTYNHKVRSVDPNTGEVRTVAGAGAGGSLDGPLASALFDEPGGIVAAADGRLYVADSNNNAIRIVDLAASSVATLGFSNLAVAVPGVVGGRTLSVDLPAQTVGGGASELVIRVSAPSGYKLNPLAPSRLDITTSNEPAVAPGEDTVSAALDGPSDELRLPVRVSAGDAVLIMRGEIYYCRDGEEAVCLIDSVDLALPLTVTADDAASAITVDYTLPIFET